jgi:hypothetical protein
MAVDWSIYKTGLILSCIGTEDGMFRMTWNPPAPKKF